MTAFCRYVMPARKISTACLSIWGRSYTVTEYSVTVYNRHRANYFRWYDISWNWTFRTKDTSGVWQVESKKFGWNVILIIAIRKIVNSREWHFGCYVCRILAFRDFIASRLRHLGGLTSSPLFHALLCTSSDLHYEQKTQRNKKNAKSFSVCSIIQKTSGFFYANKD